VPIRGCRHPVNMSMDGRAGIEEAKHIREIFGCVKDGVLNSTSLLAGSPWSFQVRPLGASVVLWIGERRQRPLVTQGLGFPIRIARQAILINVVPKHVEFSGCLR